MEVHRYPAWGVNVLWGHRPDEWLGPYEFAEAKGIASSMERQAPFGFLAAEVAPYPRKLLENGVAKSQT